MEIKTKFNVGDKVYCIDKIDGTRYKNGEATKTSVWFVSVEEGNVLWFTIGNMTGQLSINYAIEKTEGYKEEYVFSTKEEAQAECDKRNKGE